MFKYSVAILLGLVSVSAAAEEHSHPAPEKLGTVHFETSCTGVGAEFDRAVALLHSFAYDVARNAFKEVAAKDPKCAMAHWGVAMSDYHQLWSPPGVEELKRAQQEIQTAQQIGAGTERERGFIKAASAYFSDTDPKHHASRAKEYERAMEVVARQNPSDDETQMFYALSLIATAPPTDRTHANQKRAADILEPIYKRQPDHPGAAHYLIHAYDSQELASRGLKAARAYAKIAPSAPHALHMPSHTFTRLGLWDESIESNLAARRVANEQGDVGEALHAMDYLVYAYLQQGQDAEAKRVVDSISTMGTLFTKDFKIGYAATVMPVRLAVEQQHWKDALNLKTVPDAAPQVAAIPYWAHALATYRSDRHPGEASEDIAQIDACEARARAAGDEYWATQIKVLSTEARAWQTNAKGQHEEAVTLMRSSADSEDSLEKLSVTPGPIVPAREQLGQLLLELHRPKDALTELKQALKDAPGRRGALEAAIKAADATGDSSAAAEFRRQLKYTAPG
jgi:tetratricopeptide (TPR) repeat protein